MALQIHTTEIEGREGTAIYACKEFGFDVGFKLQARLAKLLTPALDAFSEGDLGGSAEKLVNLILEDLDSGLIGTLCANLTRELEGKKLKLVRTHERDAAWGGNYLEAFAALKWVLEVNFGPFFEDVGERLLEQWNKLTEPEKEPSEEGAEETEGSTPSEQKPREGLLPRLLYGALREPSGEGGNSSS